MPFLLSCLLSCTTVANIALLSEKKRAGFIVGLAAQLPWLYFDWKVGAYGLMPLAIILGVMYVRGYVKWGTA